MIKCLFCQQKEQGLDMERVIERNRIKVIIIAKVTIWVPSVVHSLIRLQ
jgi:hypothetical protein